ncbi:hypothetical protein KDJ21_015740 [Metabacillus litoralis]|uniref:hypothetical protein n=1 Tax=Metabacillus TaxID=2675233 RepID=UPI000EF5EC89|nr:hypothetical protein [Metabacillus litoralis]MCM3163885.1 hypothetical protein [Metabacillus litoralis]MCM3410602.1 hypothetical protein [Metabacillus litoralis]UHA58311.1 hypothetical protein KDJ21_015740 [Metabacillus litoralis]
MVYIKNDQHPLLYKHSANVKATSNQDSYRRNYLHEFIQSQQNINSQLKNASTQVNTLVHETKVEQKHHFDQLSRKLENQEERTTPLLDNIQKQEEAYKVLLERFEAIEMFNQELLKKHEDEGLLNQAIVDQLTIQDTAVQNLSIKLEKFGENHDDLNDKLAEQNEINEQILKTVEIQEAFHKTILQKLEQQEAINLKTSRDVDSLKATLFERISYVIDKIEENYRHVTGFINQFFTKTHIIQKKPVETENKQKESTLNK